MEDLYTQSLTHHGAPRIHQVTLGPSWMDVVSLFLEKDVLPEERSEADKVRRKASRFWLSEDRKLYKRSFSGPYLLCVHLEASELLLEELHEGVCGSHTGGKVTVSQGSYPGILVAKHAKRGAGVCQEVRSMPEVCTKHSSAWRGA